MNKLLISTLLVFAVVLAACGGSESPPPQPNEVLNRMIASGLECDEAGTFEVEADAPIPKTWEDAVYCWHPDYDTRIKIFTFESERDADMVYDYFDAFGGLFGSWLARDGLTVLQMSVDVPKDEADQIIAWFEEAAN